MLCIYLIANYLIQTWKVNGIEEKKKRLSMELGVYSILLLWLGISGKGNAVINTIVTMLFILYNLENMFYIMPSKIEMMQAKTAEDGKIIKTQELKPLKKRIYEKNQEKQFFISFDIYRYCICSSIININNRTERAIYSRNAILYLVLFYWSFCVNV